MRKVLMCGVALAGVALLVTPSFGQRNEPKKANKFQATMVTSYKSCTAPNDTTAGSLPLPACHPAVPNDDTCFIGPKGGGKALAKSDASGDVALKIKLKDIQNCDGETLQAVTSVRVTTNDCVSADPLGCTVIELTDFPITTTGSCVVSKGKCQIGTTVNTELGAGTISGNNLTVFDLKGTGLARTTGPGTPGIVAATGVLVP